jgi:hypothetical protein
VLEAHGFGSENYSGKGKSQFTSYTFIYKPLMFCYFTKSDINLKILYFPLEETPERIMQRFISWLLFDFSKGKIRIRKLPQSNNWTVGVFYSSSSQ